MSNTKYPLEVHKGEDGKLVISTAQCNHFATTFDPDAARLIAAAPELLAALEAWVDCEIASQECFKLSRAAINKAHGND